MRNQISVILLLEYDFFHYIILTVNEFCFTQLYFKRFLKKKPKSSSKVGRINEKEVKYYTLITFLKFKAVLNPIRRIVH